MLSLDTSTPATAVALRLADGTCLERRDDPPAGERPRHSTHLLPLASELLEQAGIDWDRVEAVAVGIGPGTFTGLRIGVATARALAQSLGADLLGVGSLAALAQPATQVSAKVLPVLDARRGEVFLSAYEAEGGDRPAREVAPPAALKPDALQGALQEICGGEGATSWLAVGDGALRYADALIAAGARIAAVDSSLHRVTAAAVAGLALQAPALIGLEHVVPRYGRRPDAEISIRERALP